MMPQNAWPWHSPPPRAKPLARWAALRMLSEAYLRRAVDVIRIGHSIPPRRKEFAEEILRNVLDEGFEAALASSLCVAPCPWRHRILVVGSLSPYRSVGTVLHAVRRESHSIHFAGAVVRDFSIPKATSGPLQRPELLHAMRHSMVTVFPSEVEASPVSVLEAEAVGANTVMSDIQGHRDVASRPTHWFTPKDPAALRSTLREAIVQPLEGRLSNQEERSEQRARWLRALRDRVRAVLES